MYYCIYLFNKYFGKICLINYFHLNSYADNSDGLF